MRRSIETSRFMEDLEKRINPDTEDKLYREWLDFTEGRFAGRIFSPSRSARSLPGLEWPEININETLDDFDKMALSQFKMCSDALAAGNGKLLCVRCNYGTGIMPSLFGAELFIMDSKYNTLPTTKPLPGGTGDMEKLVMKGVPPVNRALGEKVFEMGRYFIEITKDYPLIKKYISIYHPDMQGPMDICEMLWGSAIFLDINDVPGLVAELLGIITETYVAFMKEWIKIVPFCENGASVHWSMLHKGNIMLRDDSAMNFSPGYFDEFIKPYDQKLLKILGGGAMHFCGRGDHFIESASTMKGLNAINLSQPYLNDMEAIYRHTAGKGIKIIGLNKEYAEEALMKGRDLNSCVHAY